MNTPQSFHDQETAVAPSPDDNEERVAGEPEEGPPSSDDVSAPSAGELPADLAAGTGDVRGSEEVFNGERPGDEPPAAGESGDETPAAGESTGAASGETPAGAHLQLPSIDFSMPDLGGGPVSDLPTSDPSPSGELPAHLQLPNFPDFELPPIPGEEKDKTSGDIEISGVPSGAGSFGALQDGATDATAPEGAMPGAEGWSVADATQPSVPPPLPAPPPLPPGRASGPQAQSGPGPRPGDGLPSLPGLGLPALGATESKAPKEPTLVQSDVAARVAEAERKSRTPLVIVGVLLVVLISVAGTVFYLGPARVASWFGGDGPAGVVKTKRDQAEEHNYAGELAYREGTEAETAGKKKAARQKYRSAIARFRKAIGTDATFGKAHRNLAIALAKTNKVEEAVEQYRAYLRKEPDAPDKKAVLKIINDWEKSQQKKR